MDDFIRTMTGEPMWIFCFTILGLHVLASVLKTVEWAIFVRKW